MLFKKGKFRWILGGVFIVVGIVSFSWYYINKNNWVHKDLALLVYHFEYQLILSPDGSRFAYVEKKSNGKMVVILDGESQKKEYDTVRKLSFSPDSSNFSYFAERNNDQFIVLNGEELKDHIDILFAPNSERIIYIVKDGNKKFVKADNKGKSYHSIIDLKFSKDGSSFAYKASDNINSDWIIVFNNKEVGNYYEIGKFTLSPDGSSFAYEAKNNIRENWFVILDGKKLEEIEKERYDVSCSHMSFTNNNDFVYKGALSAIWGEHLFFNGEKIASHDGIDDFIFSPNGENFAYIARKGSIIDSPLDREYSIFLNGEKQETYSYIKEHLFGYQNTHFYLAAKGKDCFFISGSDKKIIGEKGIREGIYKTRCSIDELMVSKNEERVAYRRKKYPITFFNLAINIFGGKLPEEVYYVTLDGRFHETYKKIWNMSFDKNEEHFAYMASDGNDWFVVLNGKELEKHKFIVGPAFNSNGNVLSYIAVDDEIKKIDINLKK
jgi:hypothetical protein